LVLVGLRIAFGLLLVTLVAVACGDSVSDDSGVDAAAVVSVGPTATSVIVTPEPSFTASTGFDSASSFAVVGPPESDWSWQLTGVLDTSVDVDVWDVDLFETGVAEIAGLQAAGGYVICYFSAGSIEDWRPDVGVIEDSAIGFPLDDWPGENWMDIRADSALALVESRMALVERAGCDAVEPDNVDGFSNETGFPLGESDQVEFNTAVAGLAHDRGLVVGLKNSFDIACALVQHFEFAVTEQCHEYEECEPLVLSVDAGKPVFNAEYPGSETAGRALAAEQCEESNRIGIRTLFLPIDLDGSWRVGCEGR